MATPYCVFVPGQSKPIKIAALGATTASSPQQLGTNRLIQITATGNAQVSFYSSQGTAVPADATCWLIASGTVQQFDLGAQLDTVEFYNPGASAIDIYILPLARA